MKAKQNDTIRTTVDKRCFENEEVIPARSVGTIVECYIDPMEGYSVEIAIPDDTLVGGHRFCNVILLPGGFCCGAQ
jgi:hypothetical protein